MNSKASLTLRTVLFVVVCPILLIVAGSLSKMAPVRAGPLLVGAIGSGLTLALTLLFVRWDGISVRDIGLGFCAGSGPRYLVGVLIGMALVAFQNLALFAGGRTHWVIDHSHRSLAGIGLALASYLLLALREELAFRGYPLRRMEDAWGLWPAILLVGLIFSLEHTAGGWTWSHSLLGPPAGALLFGMAALATRGLAVPFGIHFAFNFAQWFMGQKETPGPVKIVVDAGFSGQAERLGYAAYLVGMLLAASAFWIWRRHRLSVS